AGCYVSMSFASQNSKLKIRMDADFQQRKGLSGNPFGDSQKIGAESPVFGASPERRKRQKCAQKNRMRYPASRALTRRRSCSRAAAFSGT
ncbi:MAG: hypothetical protein LBI85_07850, partial [Spirochaetaceae bacterium]|nr:hypothetical protein [Spirochaetaceae bacterium]